MAILNGETLAERRRLKRSIGIWRLAAVLAVAAALFALFGRGELGGPPLEDHIARIDLEGVIVGEQELLDAIAAVGEEDRAKALIVHIDSPGGTSAGSEAIYEALRKVAEKKPVVAEMGTVAASGGYIAALAADHIVARGNTITGSIGVIMQWTELKELFGKLGMDVRTVKSAALKGEPNPFDDPSPEALAMTQAMIDSSYQWFLNLVETRRDLDAARARALGDGSVFTGFQAVENGLIDEVGGEDTVLAWLENEKQIDKNSAIYVYEPEEPEWEGDFLFGASSRFVAGLFGLEGLLGESRQILSTNGLMSIWRPEGS